MSAEKKTDSDALKVFPPRTEVDALRDGFTELRHQVKSLRADVSALQVYRQRVESLEKWQWFCYGLAAAVSAVAALLFKSLGM